RLAALDAAYRHGPGKSVWVPTRPALPLRPRPGTGVPLRRLAERGDFGARLARVLPTALAPRRWEPWNANNDHRAYPSPRSSYLTEATLHIGDRRWTLDPVRLILEGDTPLPAAIASARVALSTRPELLPEGYGDLRDALGLLEAGHVTSALVEAGSAAGLDAAARAVTEGAMRGTVAEVTLRSGVPDIAVGWARVLAERSGALNPLGLSADPRPLPGELLHRLLRDARCVPGGSLAGPSAGGRLRHRLAIGRVVGVPPGLYRLDHDGPHRYEDGPVAPRIQAAFRYGPADIDLASMNVVWVITADLAGQARTGGAAEYPRTLLAAGACAQHICTAAAAAGLFCRPVRSYEEPATEAAVRADPGEDVLYMLLIGRPRALDFCYDLTSLEEPAWA
ncbi:MAG TPA: hypothetical protein VF174_12145, partial [Micromonosporaceae bacterium]